VSWFSLVIGQNVSRQLATTSQNLVASAQCLVALATSESQFRALFKDGFRVISPKQACFPNALKKRAKKCWK